MYRPYVQIRAIRRECKGRCVEHMAAGAALSVAIFLSSYPPYRCCIISLRCIHVSGYATRGERRSDVLGLYWFSTGRMALPQTAGLGCAAIPISICKPLCGFCSLAGTPPFSCLNLSNPTQRALIVCHGSQHSPTSFLPFGKKTIPLYKQLWSVDEGKEHPYRLGHWTHEGYKR